MDRRPWSLTAPTARRPIRARVPCVETPRGGRRAWEGSGSASGRGSLPAASVTRLRPGILQRGDGRKQRWYSLRNGPREGGAGAQGRSCLRPRPPPPPPAAAAVRDEHDVGPWHRRLRPGPGRGTRFQRPTLPSRALPPPNSSQAPTLLCTTTQPRAWAGGPPSSAGGGGRPEGQASSYLLLIPDFLHVTWEAKLALLSHLKHFRGGRGQQLPPGPQGRLRGCGPEGRSQGRKEQV